MAQPPSPAMRRRPDLAAPATQIVDDSEAYLGQTRRDIGRRLSDHELELFTTGDAALALQQQFETLAPDFITLHDIGAYSTSQLLELLAERGGSRKQTLTIRSQGHGIALAVIPFVDIAADDGGELRLYGTDINADSRARQQIGQVLLAHSRLAVLLLGEMPRHALHAALKPLREAIARGPWPNGDLLFVPLAPLPTLVEEAPKVTGRSGVAVQVAAVPPGLQALRNLITQTWARLLSRSGAAPDAPWDAPTEPMDLHPATTPGPMPTPTQLPLPMPVPGRVRWDDYARRCASVRGAMACCVFDLHAHRPLAHVGHRPHASRLTEQGCQLIVGMSESGRALGLGATVQDAVIAYGQQQLLLLPVNGHPGIVLLVVIDARQSSGAMARAQIEKLLP